MLTARIFVSIISLMAAQLLSAAEKCTSNCFLYQQKCVCLPSSSQGSSGMIAPGTNHMPTSGVNEADATATTDNYEFYRMRALEKIEQRMEQKSIQAPK